MAKLAEIIKKESERSELGDFLKIYLHAEGKFLHAYDVSAWLYSCHSPETFKLRCQKSKQFPDGRYVVIGHPPTEESFAKYAPKDSTLMQEEGLYTATRTTGQVRPPTRRHVVINVHATIRLKRGLAHS